MTIPDSPDDDKHDQTVSNQSDHKHYGVHRCYDKDDWRHGLRVPQPAAISCVVEQLWETWLPREVEEAVLEPTGWAPFLLEDLHHAVTVPGTGAGHGAETNWASGETLTECYTDDYSVTLKQCVVAIINMTFAC